MSQFVYIYHGRFCLHKVDIEKKQVIGGSVFVIGYGGIKTIMLWLDITRFPKQLVCKGSIYVF